MDSTLSMVMDKGADVIKAITGLYTAMYSFKDERIKAAVIEYRRAAEAMGAAVDKAEVEARRV